MGQAFKAPTEKPAGSEVTGNVPPLRVSRLLHARRETVFRAWTSTEHVKRWFCPESFSIPTARVEMRVGGPFELTMRSPAGEEHAIRGTFVELTPHERLVIDMEVADSAGTALFRAYTEVDLSEALCGTQIEVTQTYTLIDPTKRWMVAGAPEGWRSTLDKLAKEVVRMQGGSEINVRSVAHATFHLTRTYDAPAARVWKALTDDAAKQKWFGGTVKKWALLEREMDVRVGGRERLKGRWETGMVSTFDAIYHDVVPNERLIYTYTMHLDEKKISVSLATLELKAEGGKTTLMVCEQGAFLDGYDDAGAREHGTGQLLDALGVSLKD
jgi:uncharacterized protein YndB with AHSA1/START domain